ncbi:hypothetical protein ABZS51_12825, partial [Nonomuraea sp. NPDC005501]
PLQGIAEHLGAVQAAVEVGGDHPGGMLVAVMDGDPTLKPAQKTVAVKILAPVQPVPPAPIPGLPFTPVEFNAISVTPYVNAAGRLTAWFAWFAPVWADVSVLGVGVSRQCLPRPRRS